MMKKIIQVFSVLMSFVILTGCGMLNDGPYCDNSHCTVGKGRYYSQVKTVAANNNAGYYTTAQPGNRGHYASSNDNRFVINRSRSSRSNDDYYMINKANRHHRDTQPQVIEGDGGISG